MGTSLTVYKMRIGMFRMHNKCRVSTSLGILLKLPVSITQRLVLLLSTIILLGGDVGMNPGPPTG